MANRKPTSTQIINNFKTKIVPALFNVTFKEALKDNDLTVQVGCMFVNYITDLETKNFINPKMAQDLELKFVAILQNNNK